MWCPRALSHHAAAAARAQPSKARAVCQAPATSSWTHPSHTVSTSAAAPSPSTWPARSVHFAFPRHPSPHRANPAATPGAAAAGTSSGKQPARPTPDGDAVEAKGPKALPPAEARKQLAARQLMERIRVVGVSFNNHQDLLQDLAKGDALMLVREPSNPVDPNAVVVQTLHGHTVGYVPKEETFRFPQAVTFGRVESIGQEQNTGNFGLTATAAPLLPALTVDALPESLLGATNLSKALPKEDWDRLRKAAYQAAGYKCQVSGGVGPEWPVEAASVWVANDAAKTLRLAGIAALAPDVAAAKNLARLPPGSDRAAAAMDTLKAINEWSEEEAQAYLRHIDDMRAVRSGSGWQLDVSWLEAVGVSIPATLAAMPS